MKKEFTYIERKGLPGGPNEMFTYVTGVFSMEGYKRNSPDVSNPFNIIPSGSITMKDVDFPVMGTDNLGNSEMMMPGNDYQFPGDQVVEVPMAKKGGGLLTKTMKCNDCGWSWKAADGGKDISTCHKCGGSALPKAQAGKEYTVESGNTFDGIANKKEVSKNLLRNINPGIDYNDIKVDQVINVPDIKTKEERMQFFSDRRNTPMDTKDSPGISKIQTAISNGSTKQENLSYNKDILKELSKQQAERRQSLLNAANTVASAQGNNKDLEKLLVMSAVMENTLGADSGAYGRNYTRSPMSIDDVAYNDLFKIREGATKYTTQQKKNTAWLESLGINTSDIDSALRSDDPLTSMAVARLVYGRAPEALPSGDDPDALYNYYLKYYNKTGVDKYGGAEAHRDRFNDYYSKIYKELGGEVDEFQIYANYINGSYNGTEMETKAEKIYDKLNRVYYRKARALDMSSPNYIMSNIINRSGQ